MFRTNLRSTIQTRGCEVKLTLDDSKRVQGSTLLRPATYDYAPSVRWEGGKYRMMWATGANGDCILQSNSPTGHGPWTPPNYALKPSNSRATFDGAHVNDPTVIKIKNIYYCYYGGFPRYLSNGGFAPQTTMIGVMSSYNGVMWGRRNGGRPIIKPKDPEMPYTYGAGQPSAVVLGDWVYLFYMDSTGLASNPINKTGIYVIRSKNPFFTGPIEELTATGFVPRVSTKYISTEYSLADAASIDMQWSELLKCWMMAIDGVPGSAHIRLFDSYFQQVDQIEVPNVQWVEGPCWARDTRGHALIHGLDPLHRVPVIIFYPTGVLSDVATWEINYLGTELVIGA